MTQAIAENMNMVLRYREKIFTVLAVGIVSLSLSYIFFLHSAIANVVERESILKSNRVLATQVSELEGKYFSVKSKINIELAHERGFKDSDVASYISAKSVTAMANHHEL